MALQLTALLVVQAKVTTSPTTPLVFDTVNVTFTSPFGVGAGVGVRDGVVVGVGAGVGVGDGVGAGAGVGVGVGVVVVALIATGVPGANNGTGAKRLSIVAPTTKGKAPGFTVKSNP